MGLVGDVGLASLVGTLEKNAGRGHRPNPSHPASLSQLGDRFCFRLGHVGGLVLITRLNERRKQRVRTSGLGQELGMELHRDIPRVPRKLSDLDELSVGRPA